MMPVGPRHNFVVELRSRELRNAESDHRGRRRPGAAAALRQVTHDAATYHVTQCLRRVTRRAPVPT
eukprot:748595-Hanusia_phi.AAC.1